MPSCSCSDFLAPPHPGVDLVYRGDGGRLKSEFIVSSGADPAAIRASYEGIESLEINSDGSLRLGTKFGELVEEAPLVYQLTADYRRQLSGSYVRLGDHQVGFHLRPYDPSLPLVIDPEVTFSTYFGGSRPELGQAIAVDPAWHIYVTGFTQSTDFPSSQALQPGFTPGGVPPREVFVLKINPSLPAVVYATYLGRTNTETASTSPSTRLEMPLWRARRVPRISRSSTHCRIFQESRTPFCSSSIRPDRSFFFSTLIGGSSLDTAHALELDAEGNLYLAGETLAGARPFPVVNGDTPPMSL